MIGPFTIFWVGCISTSTGYDAVTEFDGCWRSRPTTRAPRQSGRRRFRQERFDKATEMYERSLTLDKNATAYSNLGTALYQQGLYADAARSFEAAVALPGAASVHWFNLGAACYWAPDLRARAKEAYETAITLGDQVRVTSSRVDPSLLAELASGHGCGAPDRGPQRKIIEAARSSCAHPTAAWRCGRPVKFGDDAEELGDLRRRIARSGDQGGLRQENRAVAVVETRGDRRYSRLRSDALLRPPLGLQTS